MASGCCERDYIFYLCPVESCLLFKQLSIFHDASREAFGANDQHNYFPHCTVTSFFRIKVADGVDADAINRALAGCMRRAQDVVQLRSVAVHQNIVLSENRSWMGLLLNVPDLHRFGCTLAQFASEDRCIGQCSSARIVAKEHAHVTMMSWKDGTQITDSMYEMAQNEVGPCSHAAWMLSLWSLPVDASTGDRDYMQWKLHASIPLPADVGN
jgi:ubiquitin-associated SH3 domain-containing protein